MSTRRSSLRWPVKLTDSERAETPPLLLLHPTDNVLVARRALQANEIVTIGTERIEVREPIGLGHKVARIAMLPGTRVLKYGAAIGSMTAPVRPGDHVHMHNMKSDYLASHTREAASQKN